MKKLPEGASEETNEKIIETLTYPIELTQDSVLSKFICQISSRVPLIPVRDKCGHFFDYGFMKDHIIKEIECPIGDQKLLMEDIVFDRNAFIQIQKRLQQLKRLDSPLTKGRCIRVFQLTLFDQKLR